MRSIYAAFLTLCFVLCVLLSACGTTSGKLGADDPFAETMVESEFFEIDGSKDTVLLGAKGTVLKIPAGAFEKAGKPFYGKVKIELAEAFTTEDMLKSGLTSVSGDKMLDTKGSIYVAATDGAEPLRVVKDREPIVEMPVSGDLAGYKIYKSTRGKAGEMAWEKASEPVKYLTTVPAEELNFLPQEFIDSCKMNYQLLEWKKPEMPLMEKLYASLQGWESGKHYDDGGASDLNEKILIGESLVFGVQVSPKLLETNNTRADCDKSKFLAAAVLLLKKRDYSQTFIHTKAFEERVQFMIAEGIPDAIAFYAKNMQNDLWKTDEAMALKKGYPGLSEAQIKRFARFAEEKWTNVKDMPDHVKKLSENFEKLMGRMNKEADALVKKINATVKSLAPDPKLIKRYEKLLWNREVYRMEKLGFKLDGNNWTCVARELELPETHCPTFSNETIVTVENRTDADRVFVYALFDDIWSIARLQESSPGTYHTAGLAMHVDAECERKVKMVAVGFKKKKWFLGKGELAFSTSGKTVNVKIAEVSEAEKDAAMQELEIFSKKSGSFNSVKKDIAYQVKFYEHFQKVMAKKRKYDLLDNLEYVGNLFCYGKGYKGAEKEDGIEPKASDLAESSVIADGKLISDISTLDKLVDSTAKLSGSYYIDGEGLFVSNCAPCHGVLRKVVGPPLGQIRKRRPVGWIVKFTQNNQKLIKMGDPDAVAIYEKYNGAAMNLFYDIPPADIKRIIYYLDHATKEPAGRP